MKRRFIVILTCIMMVVAFMPAVTFAATGNGLKYVALGDASAAGYGMADTVGYNKVAAGSYPALIRDVLKARNGSVTTSQLAMGEMRTEELLYMLDDTYKGDSYLNDEEEGFIKKHGVNEAMRNKFKNSIKSANVITYALGSVNVGSYFLYIARDVDGRCDDPNVKALVAADGDRFKAQITTAVENVINSLPDIVTTLAGDLINEYKGMFIDAASYAYYSFCNSYDKTIAKIRELNKKADIIVLGVRNMLGNLNVNLVESKYSIPIGELYNNNLIKKVNTHMQTAAGIKFISTGSVKTFLDEVYNYEGYTSSVSAQFKRYCDVLEDDLRLKNDVSSYVKGKYQVGVDKRITWGMKGVYDTVAFCLEAISKVNNITVPLSDLRYLTKEENLEKLAYAGKNLMEQLRAQSFSDAKTAADKQSITSYQSDLRNYKNKNLYKTGDVPENFGKIIMAAGMRSEMGEGFFLHPSAAGHKQIKNTIINYLCPVGPKNVRVTAAKKGFTVKWNKPTATNLKNTTGYQIRYSLKSSMKSAKTVTITKKTTTSKKITKLKAKKKYYVQVRTYRTTNGKKYFSAWSAKKSVKTKK